MRTPNPRRSEMPADPARFKRTLTLAVLLPLILTALLAGLFLWQISRLLSASQWVEHTDEVIAGVNNTQKLLVDLETGLRGYLITGRQEFLEPYERATRGINSAFDNLTQLISDNPTQTSRLGEIRRQHEQWMRFAREVIQLKSNGGDYQARVSSGDGKRIMDAMRAEFGSIIAMEESLRDERTRNTRQTTQLAVVIGLVAALMLGVFLAVFIRRQLVTVARGYGLALSAEQEQREWLDTTLRSIGDAVIATDAEGRVTFMNAVAQAITGWTMEEAVGQALPEVFRIINEETRATVENPVNKVLREGQVVGLANHTVLIAKDGHEIPIDDSGAPIKDDEEKIVGVVLVFRDITERKRAERALTESRRLLETVAANATLALFVMDKRQHCTYMNPAAERLTGYTLAEVRGHPLHYFVHHTRPDGTPYPLEECPIDRAFPQNDQERGEEVFVHRDGSFYPVAFTASPVREEGRPVGTIIEVRDIREEQRTQKELREGSAILETINRSSPTLVYLKDREGRILRASPATLSVIGKPLAEVVGKTHAEYMGNEAEGAIIAENDRRIIETGATETFEEKVMMAGELHTFLSTKTPYRDERGEIIGLVGVSFDITPRKRAEEKLLEAQNRLESSLMGANLGVWTYHVGTGEFWADESAKRMHGHEPHEVWTFEEAGAHVHPEDRERAQAAFAEAARDRSKLQMENRIIWPDGSLHWVASYANFVPANGTGVGTFYGIVQDITARKRLEAEREELHGRESGLRAEAEEANRLKDEFLATASHELRTPLTAVVGWTRMLRAGNLDEETAARALETVERNANALTKLIEDLLDISRIITGKLLLDTQPIEVAPVVSTAVNTVRPAADAKNIEMETSLDAEAGAVMADANRLQQVVWNLLSNAVKFTPREGRVSVTLRRVDSQIEISVSDTGEGIEPEFLPYVFDRFRQADGRMARKHGGLGLGLAIVRNLVEMHGGTVRAHSEGRGRGATFSVRLPLLGLYSKIETQTIPLAPEEVEASDVMVMECPPQLDGVRVLVVDDDLDTCEMLDAVLSQCDAEVVTAASAAEALQEIERRKPDVLVSDIGMPDEDGYELIRKVREMEAERGETATPALALTAYAKAEDRVRALAAGYQVHLSKPVEPAEFTLVVANLVGRGDTSS